MKHVPNGSSRGSDRLPSILPRLAHTSAIRPGSWWPVLAPFLAQITSLARDCHSLLRPSMAAFLDNTQDQDFQAFGRGRVHDLRDRAIPMVRPVF